MAFGRYVFGTGIAIVGPPSVSLSIRPSVTLMYREHIRLTVGLVRNFESNYTNN